MLLTINGERHEVHAAAHETLLEVLRGRTRASCR